MTLIINFAKGILNLIYAFMKLMPVRNKVTFLSRQADKPTSDIKMLIGELEKGSDEEDLEIVCLCKKIPAGLGGKLGYCFHILTQMKHMATSRVIVLDGYSIAVSLLNHRDSLKVIQMWHALGSLKKFGYSILDKGEGSSSKLAHAMNMHRNYDVIFTSSEASRKYFAEAFGYEENQLTVESLPRVDRIKDKETQTQIKARIIKHYPELDNQTKQTIVYAPTFRKDEERHIHAINKLIETVNRDRYNLIIKVHPLTNFTYEGEGVIVDRSFSSVDMFAAADYLILDYSALVYEGALMGKPMFFYAFDLEEYRDRRDFYIDYEDNMPGLVTASADDILQAIEAGSYDTDRVNAFADKYVEVQSGCTERIAKIIMDLTQEGTDSDIRR